MAFLLFALMFVSENPTWPFDHELVDAAVAYQVHGKGLMAKKMVFKTEAGEEIQCGFGWVRRSTDTNQGLFNKADAGTRTKTAFSIKNGFDGLKWTVRSLSQSEMVQTSFGALEESSTTVALSSENMAEPGFLTLKVGAEDLMVGHWNRRGIRVAELTANRRLPLFDSPFSSGQTTGYFAVYLDGRQVGGLIVPKGLRQDYSVYLQDGLSEADRGLVVTLLLMITRVGTLAG